MSSITIRNLDESIKSSLRLRAARHGWPMEQEVRQILQQILAPEQAGQVSFAECVNRRFTGLETDYLPIAPWQVSCTPPEFDLS